MIGYGSSIEMFMIPKENLFLHETHSEMQGSPPTRATRSASFGPLASIDPSAPASSSPSVTTGHHFGGCGGGPGRPNRFEPSGLTLQNPAKARCIVPDGLNTRINSPRSMKHADRSPPSTLALIGRLLVQSEPRKRSTQRYR